MPLSTDLLSQVQQLARLVSTLHINEAWGAEDINTWMISQFNEINIKPDIYQNFIKTLDSLKNDLGEALDAVSVIQCSIHRSGDQIESGILRLPNNILSRIFEFGKELDDTEYWDFHTGEERLYDRPWRDGSSSDEPCNDDSENADTDLDSEGGASVVDESDDNDGNEISSEKNSGMHAKMHPELTSESVEIVKSSPKKRTEKKLRPQPFSVRVSQVNKKFRSVALRNANIWSTLHSGDSIYRTRMFLDRSGVADLTVHFSWCPHFHTFLNMVAETRHRWVKVIFEESWDKYSDWDIDRLSADYYYCLKRKWKLPRLIEIQSLESNRQGDCSFRAPYIRWNMPNLRRLETSYPNLLADWTPKIQEYALTIHKNDGFEYFEDLHTKFAKMSACRGLELSSNWHGSFKPEKLKETKFFPNLRSLSIHFTQKCQVDVLEYIFHHNIPIKQLREFEILLDDMMELEYLTVLHYPGYVFESLRKLRVECIQVAHKWNRVHTEFKYDCKKMPVLEYIEIVHVVDPSITFTAGTHLPHLKRISFRSCTKVKQSTLNVLVEKLNDVKFAPSFERLEILGCEFASETRIKQIEDLMPGRVIVVGKTEMVES